MNVAVINFRDILKYFIRICILILTIYLCTNYMLQLKKITLTFSNNIEEHFLITCITSTIPVLNKEEHEKKTETIVNLMKLEIGLLNIENKKNVNIENKTQIYDEIQQENQDNNKTESPQITITKTANTEYVSERNFAGSYTNVYNTTKIDNQSNYDLTEEMMIPDSEITDKRNVIIYHTHTCESYTPCEKYNYEMTGNYRTTDSNYNVIRVGTELDSYLSQKGFKVIHDGTYHDYPAYSGSYARSLETAKNLLNGQEADIVIDLHRDAMGNGDTYGPTIMVDGQRVAQLMFVIGTDGGGLDHPNWNQNLKIAIKIQEKANEMYPGLFRPIIIRNSRYNQHVAKAASIIEVGATANTLEECLLSMQCLANVLEEVCK